MKNSGFSIIELLIVILSLIILLGVVNNIYVVGLNLWTQGVARSEIRTELSQSIELISRNLRKAISIDSISDSSIEFTANLGDGVDSYRVYLYHASDAEPNPPYTQNRYDLRWAQADTTYGLGAIIATDIVQPVQAPFVQSGDIITIDLTSSRDDEEVRLRSKVRPRNF